MILFTEVITGFSEQNSNLNISETIQLFCLKVLLYNTARLPQQHYWATDIYFFSIPFFYKNIPSQAICRNSLVSLLQSFLSIEEIERKKFTRLNHKSQTLSAIFVTIFTQQSLIYFNFYIYINNFYIYIYITYYFYKGNTWKYYRQ